jgi:hypothetical protein
MGKNREFILMGLYSHGVRGLYTFKIVDRFKMKEHVCIYIEAKTKEVSGK